MKKRVGLALVVCLLLSVVMLGCGDKAETPVAPEETSLADIQEKGYFVVGLDDAFPPMGFREEGTNQIVGFDIDLATEVASRLGVEARFQPVVWETIIEELNGGMIDLIWNGLTITPARQEQIAFTQPYMEDKQLIVVRKDSDISSKEDLAGKIIGLQAGSSAYDAVEADAETFDSLEEIMQFGGNDEALMDLAAGRLDAVVVDEVVGRYYIAKRADDYTILEDNFGVEEFGVGLRQSDQSFIDAVQQALDGMKADGTSLIISQKWFGDNVIK